MFNYCFDGIFTHKTIWTDFGRVYIPYIPPVYTPVAMPCFYYYYMKITLKTVVDPYITTCCKQPHKKCAERLSVTKPTVK